MTAKFNFKKKQLCVPEFGVVAEVLQNALSANFVYAKVDVVDCPDLSEEPFYLTCKGIGGSPCLLSCGSMHNFMPVFKKDKIYNIKDFPALTGLKSALFIGAGAICSYQTNSLLETIINVSLNEGELDKNETKTARMDGSTNKCVVQPVPKKHSEFACVLDVLCSRGLKSKVLRVHCSRRTGELPFQSVLRNALSTHFRNHVVGLGGAFLMKQGKAKCHISHLSTDYPPANETSIEDFVKASCDFVDLSAPLISVGEIISQDLGLDLRLEHFHCFSLHGDGGHFHYDTTPESVEYLGYFSVAESLFRIDRPRQEI